MPYCDFILGNCTHKDNVQFCAGASAVSCRNRRDENERALRELAEKRAGVTADEGE